MIESSNSMDLPRVFVVSNCYERIAELMKKLGAKCFSKEESFENYVLKIDNKYYTAEIVLCILKNLSVKLDNYSNIEGLIIYHNLNNESEICQLDMWSFLIEALCAAEVRLLVCDSITETSVKDRVTEWCTLKKFESVELECSDPTELSDLEFEHNTFGIDRIIEALHAHRWPNIILKGAPQNDVNRVGQQLENISLNPTNDVSERLRMESVLDGIMGNEDADFGELFGQLRAMKEHAASLPLNERRIAAEQLVTAFWKAMGGDPSEVDELD